MMQKSNFFLQNFWSNTQNRFIALFLILAFIIIGVISQKVIQNFPNSADEYAYIFQARNLAKFQVYAPIHKAGEDGFRMQDYFYFVHIGETDGKYYGRFPFGYSLLLVPAAWMEMLFKVDLYWTINAIFGALTLLLIFLTARRLFNELVAVFAVFIMLVNPWFLFTCASFFSHSTCAFFILLSFYLLLIAMEQQDKKKAKIKFLLSGLAFGYAILIRFLDPLAYLIPFAIAYLFLMKKEGFFSLKKTAKDGLWFSLGIFICLFVLILYNKALTGKFFLTAYQYFNPSDSGTRFIFLIYDNGKNIVDFSRIYKDSLLPHIIPNLKLLTQWFIPVYLLILLPVVLFLKRKNVKELMINLCLLLMILFVIILYTLYGGPAVNQYGPRYFFTAIIPLSLLAGYSLVNILKDKYKAVLWIVLIVILFLSLLVTIDKGKASYAQIFDRRNVFRTVAENKIHNAVVILVTESGGMYRGDLMRNDLDFKNDIIYAHSLSGYYNPLIKYYNHRTFYEYRYKNKEKLGELTRLILKNDGTYYREGQPKLDFSKMTKGNKEGLTGFYYHGLNFDELAFKRVDPVIDFNWGTEKVDKRLPADNFSIKWQGFINIPKRDQYNFWTASDDGIQLYIDGNIIIDNWQPHAETEDKGEIVLEQGWHAILLNYNDVSMHAIIKLYYNSSTIKKSIIPQEQLCSFLEDEK